jgi:hypothetical protein
MISLTKSIDRSDLELLEMDRFLKDSIDKLIKPEMREEYENDNIIFYQERARNCIQLFNLME